MSYIQWNVIQDGGTFLVWYDETGENFDIFQYSETVKDHDMNGAVAARMWFYDKIVPENVHVVFT